jgi:hypothetical protein
LGGACRTQGGFNPSKDNANTKPIATIFLFIVEILCGPFGTLNLDVSTTQIDILVNNVCFSKIEARMQLILKK